MGHFTRCSRHLDLECTCYRIDIFSLAMMRLFLQWLCIFCQWFPIFCHFVCNLQCLMLLLVALDLRQCMYYTFHGYKKVIVYCQSFTMTSVKKEPAMQKRGSGLREQERKVVKQGIIPYGSAIKDFFSLSLSLSGSFNPLSF